MPCTTVGLASFQMSDHTLRAYVLAKNDFVRLVICSNVRSNVTLFFFQNLNPETSILLHRVKSGVNGWHKTTPSVCFINSYSITLTDCTGSSGRLGFTAPPKDGGMLDSFDKQA